MSFIQMRNDTLVSSIAQQICDHLKLKNLIPPEYTSLHIRIREKTSNRADKILQHAKTMTQNMSSLFDSRNLCFQILDHPETVVSDDTILLCQKWNRSTRTLGECFEIAISGTTRNTTMARQLSEMLSIPLQHLRVMLCNYYSNRRICEFADEDACKKYNNNWVDPMEGNYCPRGKMFLNNGDLLLLQDISEPLCPLTKEDILSLQLVAAADSTSPAAGLYGPSQYDFPYLPMTSGSGSSNSGSRNTGIKITIRGKENSMDPSPVTAPVSASTSNANLYSLLEDEVNSNSSNNNDNIPERNHSAKEVDKQGGLAIFSDLH